MTPREPDRFDKQAREILSGLINTVTVAAALRAAESSALERAAQSVEAMPVCTRAGVLQILRALIPPAAAPAADYDPITAPIPAGDMNGPHGPLPAITYVNADQWAAAGQPPLDDKKPREPGCQCHQEEGDSPCPVHGEDAPAAETGKAQGAWKDYVGQPQPIDTLLRDAASALRSLGDSPLVRDIEATRIALAARAAPPEGEGT